MQDYAQKVSYTQLPAHFPPCNRSCHAAQVAADH